MGKVFTNGFSEKGKKDGLSERYKNIELSSTKLLKEIKNQRTIELDKKDSKTSKTKNFLIYDKNHNFYKYRLDKLVEIPSVDI